MAQKQRLSDFNRANILTAADALFREKSIVQTTMDDIAKMADYSKSTLYVYFKSKDEIYHSILLGHIEMLKDRISAALRDFSGFPDGYFAMCDTFVNFYASNPLYFESFLDEIKLPEDGTESVLSQIYQVGEAMNRIIEGYINTWLARQEISLDISPLQATFTLWAGISGIITLAHKKETYIGRTMKISKEAFMRNGFDLLIKSISGKN